jgi:dTDP-4-dehydrorhamnose 3,5-epimerase
VPTDEKTLLWNDQTININWPLEKPPVISAKDQQGLKLDDLWGLIS